MTCKKWFIVFCIALSVKILGCFLWSHSVHQEPAGSSVTDGPGSDVVVTLKPSAKISITPYTEVELKRLLDNKHAVLVLAGADWCKYCKVNERILFSDEVKAIMEKKGITIMKIDLSMSNPEGLRYLKSCGQSGIPYEVLYINGKSFVLPLSFTAEEIIQFFQTNIVDK